MANDSAPNSHGRPNVITSAQISYDDAMAQRRRKYVIMMALRIPFLVLAAVFYQTPWLAILMIVVSIPLPWAAVMIANDGPARTRARAPRGVFNNQRAIAGPGPDVIDAPAGTPGADAAPDAAAGADAPSAADAAAPVDGVRGAGPGAGGGSS